MAKGVLRAQNITSSRYLRNDGGSKESLQFDNRANDRFFFISLAVFSTENWPSVPLFE